jgi:hypothetical protein
MSDLNRGIISAVLVLGSIVALIVWAMTSAYAF